MDSAVGVVNDRRQMGPWRRAEWKVVWDLEADSNLLPDPRTKRNGEPEGGDAFVHRHLQAFRGELPKELLWADGFAHDVGVGSVEADTNVMPSRIFTTSSLPNRVWRRSLTRVR